MTKASQWLGLNDKDLWLDRLARLPHGLNDVYGRPEYVQLYTGDDSTAQCFLYEQGDKLFLYPFLQQRTPYLEDYYDITTAYGYGGPVFNSDDPAFLKAALDEFRAQALERNIVAELIKFNPMYGNHAPLQEVFGGEIIPMCNTVYVEMDIDEEYRWMKEYTAANRKGIKKSIRQEAEADFNRESDAWAQFEALYFGTMKHNSADDFYLFSEQYFAGIRETLADNYILSTARIDGNVGASMILLYGEEYAYCHLIGTNRDYQKFGVNNFLHHHCIQWCKEQGFKRLLIGGGRGLDDDDPLLRFKKNFSKQLSMFHVGEQVLNESVYKELIDLRNEQKSEPVDTVKLFKYRF